MFADVSARLEKTRAEVRSAAGIVATNAAATLLGRDQEVSLSAPGSSEAGGQGAGGGWADGAPHRDAGERPGGAAEEGPGDQSSPPKWGQRPLFTGELEELGGGL